MHIKDFGKASLVTSAGSWGIGIIFTLLSWWAADHAYSNYQSGDPKPESLMMDVFPLIAAIAFPGAIVATVLGIIALYKHQNTFIAFMGIITSVPLFGLFGAAFWIASYHGL